VDRSKTQLPSDITAKKNGMSPDKRHKYDAAFKTEALPLSSEKTPAWTTTRVKLRGEMCAPPLPEGLVSEALRRTLLVRQLPTSRTCLLVTEPCRTWAAVATATTMRPLNRFRAVWKRTTRWQWLQWPSRSAARD